MSKSASVPTSLSPRQEALLEAVSTQLRRAVLHHLRERGPLQRGELQELTGVTRGAVLQTLDLFEGLGAVVANWPPGERHGRQVIYDVDPKVVLEIIEVLAAHILPSEVTLRVSGPVNRD